MEHLCSSPVDKVLETHCPDANTRRKCILKLIKALHPDKVSKEKRQECLEIVRNLIEFLQPPRATVPPESILKLMWNGRDDGIYCALDAMQQHGKTCYIASACAAAYRMIAYNSVFRFANDDEHSLEVMKFLTEMKTSMETCANPPEMLKKTYIIIRESPIMFTQQQFVVLDRTLLQHTAKSKIVFDSGGTECVFFIALMVLYGLRVRYGPFGLELDQSKIDKDEIIVLHHVCDVSLQDLPVFLRRKSLKVQNLHAVLIHLAKSEEVGARHSICAFPCRGGFVYCNSWGMPCSENIKHLVDLEEEKFDRVFSINLICSGMKSVVPKSAPDFHPVTKRRCEDPKDCSPPKKSKLSWFWKKMNLGRYGCDYYYLTDSMPLKYCPLIIKLIVRPTDPIRYVIMRMGHDKMETQTLLDFTMKMSDVFEDMDVPMDLTKELLDSIERRVLIEESYNKFSKFAIKRKTKWSKSEERIGHEMRPLAWVYVSREKGILRNFRLTFLYDDLNPDGGFSVRFYEQDSLDMVAFSLYEFVAQIIPVLQDRIEPSYIHELFNVVREEFSKLERKNGNDWIWVAENHEDRGTVWNYIISVDSQDTIFAPIRVQFPVTSKYVQFSYHRLTSEYSGPVYSMTDFYQNVLPVLKRANVSDHNTDKLQKALETHFERFNSAEYGSKPVNEHWIITDEYWSWGTSLENAKPFKIQFSADLRQITLLADDRVVIARSVSEFRKKLVPWLNYFNVSPGHIDTLFTRSKLEMI